MSENWIVLASGVMYCIGILGAVQVLSHFMCDKEGAGAFLLFLLGVTLWPAIMPVAGISWLWLGTNSWAAWEEER